MTHRDQLNTDLAFVCQGCGGDGCHACGHTGIARRKPFKQLMRKLRERHGATGIAAGTCSRCGRGMSQRSEEAELPAGALCNLCRYELERGVHVQHKGTGDLAVLTVFAFADDPDRLRVELHHADGEHTRHIVGLAQFASTWASWKWLYPVRRHERTSDDSKPLSSLERAEAGG